MFLSNLSIENYRAIKNANLSFNSTTFWIGENESGKSSIIEALSKVLNADDEDKPPIFVKSHFHHSEKTKQPIGAIKIKLLFEERFENEWMQESYEPIFFLFAEENNSIRKLELIVEAEPTSGGESKSVWKLNSFNSGKSTSNSEIFKWLRAKCPVIFLSAGMLTGKGSDNIPLIDPPLRNHSIPDNIMEKIITIQGSASAILTRNTTSLTDEINKGFEAAKKLFDNLTENNKTKNLGLTQKVGEILGKGDKIREDDKLSFSPQSGNNSQRLGAVLLLAAILRASPEGFNREMEPIWLIENPEAHLHPMTLASVAFLINQIKWQKIVTTYSSNLLGTIPLRQVRRLVRYHGVMMEYKVGEGILSREDNRRISYHLRTRHGVASFARLWLLVEGETEFWMLPQFARLLGYDFQLEGIRCIDFAQSGLASLIKVAGQLGIKWHLLTDGDNAGSSYSNIAKEFIPEGKEKEYITMLKENDIEHCFYKNGYANEYKKFAKVSKDKAANMSAGKIISQAIKIYSKPFLALSLTEAVAKSNSPGIPKPLVKMIETSVRLAREAPF